ncbi:MAG TPA: AAA family ATPase [Chloroflexota bacterium]|nr:AAA family ATPase [Chloroflexota bacterium]
MAGVSPLYTHVGEVIRRYRQVAGLTQEELAERAEVGVRVVSDIERGVPRAHRPATIARLADALGLSPQDRAEVQSLTHRGDVSRLALLHTNSSRPAGGPSPIAPSTSPPLIGRARELDLLERHLGGMSDFPGSVPMLLLGGEPGIGKSRLLHEAAVWAAEHGLYVLEGGCRRSGGQGPYAPLSDALAAHVATQTPAQLELDLQGCAWLVRLLPELAGSLVESLPAQPLPPEQERRLMVEAVLRFLTNVTSVCGAVLILDDLQWAGADALDLLAAVVHGIPSDRLCMVGAYRDTEVGEGDPLAVMLADLAHARLVRHHSVTPLSQAQAARLLDALLPGLPSGVRGRVLRRSGGVPFFMMSYVQALQLSSRPDEGDKDVPWDVTQSIRQRMAALPPAARAVLQTAAVIGRWVPRAVLTAAVEHADDDGLTALDLASRARLLEEDAATDAYLFAHDVVREVIEAELGVARRVVLHRRVADVLERAQGEPPVELLAYHYGRSDDQDKALLYLERAGDRAGTQAAHSTASEYYRELVRRLDALGKGQHAAQAREKLSIALRLSVRYAAALEVAEQVAESYRLAGDLDALGRVMAHIALLHTELGTVEQGLTRMQALLLSLEVSGARRGAAQLYVRLSLFMFIKGQYAAQLSAAERGAELARAIDDHTIRADAEGMRGHALLLLGHIDEALACLERAIVLAEAGDDPAILINMFINIATACMYRGEFERSRQYTDRSIELAERHGHPAHRVLVRLRHAFIALFVGDWPQAREIIEWSIAQEHQLAGSWGFAYPLLSLGALCFLEGKWDEAEQHLERCAAIALQNDDIEALRWAHSRLAERDLFLGRPDAARRRLAGLLDRPGLEEIDVTMLLPRVAWTRLELGQFTEAGHIAAQASARARRQGHRIALADALWVQGMVLAAGERWEASRAALDEGLALVRAMPYPYCEARIEEAYGVMSAAHGDDGAARRHLEEAHALFSRLGARRDAARVAELMR